MKRLFHLTGSIVLGSVIFQLGVAFCILSVAYFTSANDAATFSQAFALAQLLGLTLTFGMTSAIIAEESSEEAIFLSGLVVILALIVGIIVFPFLFLAKGTLALGIIWFAISLAKCDIFRSEAIGTLKIYKLLLNFIGVALAISILGVVFIFSQNLLLGFILAGALLSLTWFSQANLNSLAEVKSLFQILEKVGFHWRYFVFRTPTILLDFLSSKGIILVMGAYPSSYTVFFFITQRIFTVPVQHLTYALSLSLLRQARSEKSLQTRETVKYVWNIISMMGIIIIPISAAVLALVTNLSLPIKFGPSEAITSLSLLLYTFYLSYVTWLGRLFDLNGEQASAFKVEVIGKLVIVVTLYQFTLNASLYYFAPTFFCLQLGFGILWLTSLFRRLGWELDLIVKGFIFPITAISGLSFIVLIFFLR